MKAKNLLAIALFALILVSATAITAYAARGGNPGPNSVSGNLVAGGRGSEKAMEKSSEKAQEKLERAGERVERAQERLAGLKERINEKLEEKRQERLAAAEENESNETENETEDNVTKIAPGRLISQVQQARREVWQETKEILKEAGYHGRVDEFQRLFNQFTKSMKVEIREKLAGGNDTNLSAEVVREIAERELTRVREEILARMNITAENETNETNETVNSATLTVIKAQLAGASPKFRGKFLISLQDATPEEKAEIISQINEFAQTLGGEAQIRIKERDAEKIREKLKNRERIRD